MRDVLHWLPIKLHVELTLRVLLYMYNSLHKTCPSFVTDTYDQLKVVTLSSKSVSTHEPRSFALQHRSRVKLSSRCRTVCRCISPSAQHRTL